MARSFFERLGTDQSLEREGVWVRIREKDDDGDEIDFRIRHFDSKEVRSALAAHKRKFQAFYAMGEVPKHIELEQQIAICCAALTDWRGGGLTDADGTLLAFTPANVERAFREARDARENVLWLMRRNETFRQEGTIATGNGSSPSSAPSSTAEAPASAD